MPPSTPPSIRTLIGVWLILIVLSAGTLFAGGVTTDDSNGIWAVAALLTITFFKTKLILNFYLHLKAATGNWGAFFTSLIVLILLAVFGIYSVSFL